MFYFYSWINWWKVGNEVLYSEFGVFSFSLSENKRLFKHDLIMEPETAGLEPEVAK